MTLRARTAPSGTSDNATAFICLFDGAAASGVFPGMPGLARTGARGAGRDDALPDAGLPGLSAGLPERGVGLAGAITVATRGPLSPGSSKIDSVLVAGGMA